MKICLKSLAVIIVILTSVSSVLAEEYMVYAPKPMDGELNGSLPADGVIVKSITLQRGDTLYKLSKKFSGKGSYYPQILLFNDIKNPDLIFAGSKLRVPVTSPEQKEANAEKSNLTKRTLPVAGKQSVSIPTIDGRSGSQVRDLQEMDKPVLPQKAVHKGELRQEPKESSQILYEKAINNYHAGNYDATLKILDELLTKYPSSPIAPDAALYRADCLMKLSDQ